MDIDIEYDLDGRIDIHEDTGSVLDLDYTYDAAGFWPSYVSERLSLFLVVHASFSNDNGDCRSSAGFKKAWSRSLVSRMYQAAIDIKNRIIRTPLVIKSPCFHKAVSP